MSLYYSIPLDPYSQESDDGNMDAANSVAYLDLSLSAILTSSGKDLACIFFIT